MKMKPNGATLAKALENAGPLPSWLFANSVVAGFLVTLLSSLLGAFAAVFFSYFVNIGTPKELYDAGIFGAAITLLLSALFVLINIVTALKNPDEATERVQFSIGIMIAAILLVALYFLTKDMAQLWLVG
jgi:hypothetical protein